MTNSPKNRIVAHLIDGENHSSGAQLYYLDCDNILVVYPPSKKLGSINYAGSVYAATLDFLRRKEHGDSLTKSNCDGI